MKDDGGGAGVKWDVVEGGQGDKNLDDAAGDLGERLVEKEYNENGQHIGNFANL